MLLKGVLYHLVNPLVKETITQLTVTSLLIKGIKSRSFSDLMCFLRDITEGKPLPLEVMGIEYMNDDPAMVDVLYAKVNVKDGSDKSVFERD